MPRHWPPRNGETVFDASRDRQGLQAYGTIYSVDREWPDPEEGTVFVRFKGLRVTRMRRKFFWHGELRNLVEVRLNGIRHCPGDPWLDVKEQHETRKSYELWELDGNWSSTDGGEGLWSLE